MFRSPQNYRTFLTVVLTYTLDLVGFSIAFPVIAPLLLNAHSGFFAPDTALAAKTTVIGLIFAIFGVAQFIGSPIAGALADHYGRYKVFLWSIALSIVGYALMAVSIYAENLTWLFIGRIVTGLCSGNFALAQSATADLTDDQHRSRAFGILLGVGGLGFVAGPWAGGILANPNWLHGSGAFIFAAIASLINLIVIYFFYVETWQRKKEHAHITIFHTFKDIRLVFQHKTLRKILNAYLLFSVGWAFFLIFSPTFLVQKFSMNSHEIGNVYAYMSVVWFFGSMYLNQQLSAKCSLRTLFLIGTVIATVGVALFVFPNTLWPYWYIIPIALIGGALSWVNIGALLSLRASKDMQGRAMGAGGSMWSIGQIISPLAAGPLAGWNMYSPLLIGSVIILLSFLYFLLSYKDTQRS